MMHTHYSSRVFAALSLCLLAVMILEPPCQAQTASGLITGVITDPSGAVVPQVKVTIKNQGTGMTWSATTSDAGKYTVTALPVGIYTVTATKQGFRSAERADISLSVGATANADFKLVVGSVAQVVTVKANTVSVNTVSASQTQLVNQRQIADLPLNGRNFTEFLTLNAGTVSSPGAEAGSMRQGKGTGYNVNGNRTSSVNFTLDGLINTDVTLGDPAVIVSQDAMQQFKEQKPAYSAAYGFSASQINIITKSGTNQLHGTAFEFGRNDKLDATNFFATSKPELRQNQFGFVLGGPVYIPKVYNGRDKTFWLANYEGWRIRQGGISQGIVPDASELNGDFSSLNLPAFGTPACNSALLLDQPCMPINPATGQSYPGDQIPTTSFSHLATQSLALQFFPAPNCSPAACAGNNYRVNETLPTGLNQQTYKFDQDLGRLGKVFFRFTLSNYATSTLGTLSGPVGNNNFTEQERSLGIGWSITLGSHSVNSFRIGRLGATANQCGTAISQSTVSSFGFTGVFQNLDTCARSAPGAIGIANFAGVGGPTNDTTISYVPTWEYADDFSTVHGQHTLQAGFDFRTWVQTRNLAADFLGTFNYRNDLVLNNGGSGADGCPTLYCGTGNALADFLLGYYQNSGIFQPGPFSQPGISGNQNNYVEKYFAPYIEDSWRVRQNLTLNIGLRWDFRTVPYEESNKFFWLDGQNPGGGLCYADPQLATDGVAPAGNGIYRYCGRRSPANSGLYKPFAPRFGFAWQPFGGDKTVVRGGYGIFYDSPKGREIDDSGDIYPFEVRSSYTPQIQPTAPKLTDQLFPATTAVAPVTPQDITFLAVIQGENPHNAYVQQWSLDVQRQLATNTVLDVGYEGSKGTHLLTRTDISQAYAPSDPNFCSAQDANGNFINLNQGDCPVATRRPYSNFTGTYIDSEFQGVSSYDSANVNLTRRTSSMVMQMSYAWSHSLDDKSAAAGIGDSGQGYQGFLDNHDPKLDYSTSDFDVNQRFVTNFIYQLPLGRGQHFGASMNKVADAVIGNWRVGGILTLQKGFPFTIYASDPFGLLNNTAGYNRANQVGPAFGSGTGTVNEYFNTAAFAQPLPAHFGFLGRNTLRGPGLHTFDMNISKSFPLTERVRLEVRIEAFNIFNTPQFGNPDTTLTDPNFGVISGTSVDNRELQWGAKILF
ncbi:MAG TPA: carboxypeptidase-like regulatory domain-containing protein [Terriglobia bacterium]|nr:carboxypeptidase-like regulatory domain-containing protein [Terriglobia bacterium]